MRQYGIRQKLGAIVLDAPRFAWALASDRWPRYRNRTERLAVDAATGGARCQWLYTSDLHLCGVFPATGRRLLRAASAGWPFAFADDRPADADPEVSFVIGHRGEERLLLLLRTLSSIAAQRRARVECIVVEQSESSLVQERLPGWVRYLHTPVASDAQPYNRSAALNAGARAARGRVLVLHDNDFLVPADYAAELRDRHAQGWQFIDLKRFMFYLSEEESARVAAGGSLDVVRRPERVVQNLLAGGSVAADRQAYFEIGGFDESFVGWGGEDNEFWERASTRRTFAFAYLPFVHLWHAPQKEKAAADPVGGRARYLELMSVPPEERIGRLRASGSSGQ